MKHKLKNKINQISNSISQVIVERDAIVKLCILGIFSKESVFLLGPPGIAKSLISRKISSVFKNSKQFEVLMNKFTLTDEIFGPIDILALKEGRFKRKIDGYLPDANIAFLDEIWKASSSIQNTLLTIINEKIFVNDGEIEKVDLYFLIAASNELPERKQNLEALWDRFLMKFNIEPIQDEKNFVNMITNQEDVLAHKTISDKDIIDFKIVNEVYNELKTIKVDEDVLNFILETKKEIKKQNDKVLKQNPFADGFDQFYVSDRKWKKNVNLLKASAYLNERESVNLTDLNIIYYTLWNNLEQFDFYKKFIGNKLYEFKYKKIFDTKFAELSQLREKLIKFTTRVTEKERVVIKAVENEKGLQFNRFVDENKNIYYLLKEDMDSISTKADLKIDWLISYVTEEEFNLSKIPTKKFLVKYSNSSFYIYENNDESERMIEIITEFVKEKYNEYELIRISDLALEEWEIDKNKFLTSIEKEIKQIEKYKKTVEAEEVNIFWDRSIIEDELNSATKAQDKLRELKTKVNAFDEEKNRLKFGFTLTNIDTLFSLDKKE
ncbi:AAA family ATPase [Mycoplasma iguanae]|uniref:AAA family ATPase n=1 Tax=Mycoplasma iguanae TaxID=292461 RepID=A0ABY5R7I2_9MOLU|nr:AAA family ATPase [Mycoplasma iguanae]UVD81439.1 AAA family ATPase [Mycoplasma iguanae]